MTKNKTTKYTQNKAVISYLRKRHNSKMTTEKICNGIKTDYNTNLTIQQVSRCLNRFSVKNLVGRTNEWSGMTSNGRKAIRWYYVAPKKS